MGFKEEVLGQVASSPGNKTLHLHIHLALLGAEKEPPSQRSERLHGPMEEESSTLFALAGLCGMLEIFFNPPKEKELTRACAKIFSKFKRLLFDEESGWPGASSSDLTSQPGGLGLPFSSSPHSGAERQFAYSGFFRKAHFWFHLFVGQP